MRERRRAIAAALLRRRCGRRRARAARVRSCGLRVTAAREPRAPPPQRRTEALARLELDRSPAPGRLRPYRAPLAQAGQAAAQRGEGTVRDRDEGDVREIEREHLESVAQQVTAVG